MDNDKRDKLPAWQGVVGEKTPAQRIRSGSNYSLIFATVLFVLIFARDRTSDASTASVRFDFAVAYAFLFVGWLLRALAHIVAGLDRLSLALGVEAHLTDSGEEADEDADEKAKRVGESIGCAL